MRSGAGLVLSVRGERRYLPALLVQTVVARPRLSPVPGSPLSLAWVSGRAIAVAEAGSGPHLVVCVAGNEIVGVAGVEVDGAGFFTPQGDGVLFEGSEVPPFDVAAELERVQEAASKE